MRIQFTRRGLLLGPLTGRPGPALRPSLEENFRPGPAAARRVILGYQSVDTPDGLYWVLPRRFLEAAATAYPDAENAAELPASCEGAPLADGTHKWRLQPNQAAVVRHVLDAPWGSGRAATGGAIYVDMPTGRGKTVVGCALAASASPAAPGLGTGLIIVPSSRVIAGQWRDDYGELYGKGEAGAARGKAATFAWKKGTPWETVPGPRDAEGRPRIVVAVVNSLRDRCRDDMLGVRKYVAQFDMVAFDEAHEFQSPRNIDVLWAVQAAPRVLGLSASPDEMPSGLDRGVFMWLGAPLDTETAVPGVDAEQVVFSARVRALRWRGNPEYARTVSMEYFENGKAKQCMSAIKTIQSVTACPDRLSLVVEEVRRLALPDGRGRPAHAGVMIFTETRALLPRLAEALRAAGGEGAGEKDDGDEDEMVLLWGGRSERQAAADYKKARGASIVLTTLGYSKRGTSLPHCTALVLVTPRRNGLNQIIGRIMRLNSDREVVRDIVDIIDRGTGLEGQFHNRRKLYEDRDYDVETVDCDYPRGE